MKIEIEVISTEIIHPSSQTPKDVSNYKISFLDQMHSPDFMLFTFFYEATGSPNNSEISSRLKKSLSKTLSLYYPLAGRFVDGSNVNCKDQGIIYMEAIANNCTFEDVIKEPIPRELDKLLPARDLDHDISATDVCIKIQATFFKCGGFAIGIALSHKLADAQSLLSFLNCWAAISREDVNNIRSPIFDGATLFPPRDLGGNNPSILMESKENIITKRFIFTDSKINELRDKYTNTSRASRVEALLGFIWTRFMDSTQRKNDKKTVFTLLHAVNFRKRAVPPFSEDLFGNFVLPAIIVGDNEDGTYKVIEKMREAVRKIDGDFISKLREGTQILDSLNDNANMFLNCEVEPFYFTSLCRFPVFEADFGWGKPVWIAPGSGRFKNAVSFIDSSSGGGIEAWVYLEIEDMAKFEADMELLAYATA